MVTQGALSMPLVKRRHAAQRHAATALDAASPADRRAAALAMAGEPAATGALLDAIVGEPAHEVRAAMMTALISIGTEEAAAGLAALLASKDIALRNDAIEALRRMGDVVAGPLAAILAEPDPGRRIFAITALEGHRGAWARALLRTVLAEDEDVNVGLAAVEALSLLGEADDVPALHAFAERFAHEPAAAFVVSLAAAQASDGLS
jgi:HEAT repeat protein